MLIIELNEFNPELLGTIARELGLSHILRMLALQHTHTRADCEEERHGLDPWVQWVSFHTGLPSHQHGIQHLGDVRHLQHPQMWECSSAINGFHVGLWGVMNASAGAHPDRVDFFFPDPWTFSKQASPRELDNFLRLPRYFAKNYLDLEYRQLLLGTLAMLGYIASPTRLLAVMRNAGICLRALFRGGLDTTILFGIFDLINAALFSLYKKRHNPHLSIIFLNSIAHLQHHAWREHPQAKKRVNEVMRLLDQTLEILFTSSTQEELLVINGFRQIQAYEEQSFLYRQINPVAFLRTAGIESERVEQLMTNDAHVFVSDEKSCYAAVLALREARLDGKRIFDAEISAPDPCQFFYQIDFWEHVPAGSLLVIGGKTLDFYAWFERIVQRTGKHVPEGDVFSRGIDLPQNAAIHELSHHIREHLWNKQKSM